MMSDADATAMSEDMVDATVSLKLRSCSRIPPARKQQPRTSRMLERMLPSMLACTMRISPCLSATILTISSTALPKVAFIRPPSVCPSFAESSSVAKDSSAASGIMAMKLRMKTAVGFQLSAPAMMPMGTKTRKTLT